MAERRGGLGGDLNIVFISDKILNFAILGGLLRVTILHNSCGGGSGLL